MEAWEAMARSIGRETAHIAKAVRRSTSLVAKWKEPTVDFSDSGALSDLDRLEMIIEKSLALNKVSRVDSVAPIQYLATRFGMCLIDLPPTLPCLSDVTLQVTHVCREFGNLMGQIGDALTDGRITPDERRAIEREGFNLLQAVGSMMAVIQAAAK